MVLVLLLLIYRSPVLWLLPMLAVTGGLFTAQAAITLLARSGALTLTDLSAGILNVLVSGAATDYALLLIARYREQLHTTAEHRAALAAAVRATTPAIAASGGTVIAAMLCLLAATINSNRGLGPVAARHRWRPARQPHPATRPARRHRPAHLLAPHPHLTAPPPAPAAERSAVAGRPASVAPAPSRGWARLGARLAQRPRRVWVLSALVLAAAALGLLDTRLGLPQAGTFRGRVEAVQGQRLLDAHFPAGASAPAQILTDTDTATAVQQVTRATPGVVDVASASSAGGRTLLEATLADQPDSPAAEHTVAVLRGRLAQLPAAHTRWSAEPPPSSST